MKTKTGRLLMSHIKGKSNQVIPVETQNHTAFQTQHITPVKPKSLQQVFQENDKHNEVPEQTMSEMNSDLHEITHLRQENIKLSKQIQTLKSDLQFHQLKPQFLSKQVQTVQPKDQEQPKEQKPEIKDSKNFDSKYFFKLKQKCSALQVQNYRLIENNYLLLMKLKKNLKFFKESLGNILSKIQGLEFSQAVKEVYSILSGLKNDELGSFEFQRRIFPNKIEQQPLEEQKQKQVKNAQKVQNLQLKSSLFNIQYSGEQKLEQRENQIQIKMQTLHQIKPKPASYSSRQSCSFHLINSRSPDPDFFNNSNNKLFNSEINDHDYQISGLDQVSLQDKFQNDWDHSAKKQPIIYKLHGNTTQLYKMLMLQAITIEGFFPDS